MQNDLVMYVVVAAVFLIVSISVYKCLVYFVPSAWELDQKLIEKMKLSLGLGYAFIAFAVPAFMYFIYPWVGHGFTYAVENILWTLGTIYIFRVPLFVWMLCAFPCYVIGFFLFRKCLKGRLGIKVFSLSALLMSMPLCVLILHFFSSNYEGP